MLKTISPGFTNESVICVVNPNQTYGKMTEINANVGALLAIVQARAVQKDVESPHASGLRVITVADDAAGLVVYKKMSSQIRRLSTDS